MAQQIHLEAAITDVAGGALRVGANPQPSNQFTLSIENKGNAIVSETRIPPNLYLQGRLGPEDAALFSKKEDARNYCTITKPDQWNCEWDFPGDASFCLKIYSYDDTLFKNGESIEIALSNVISKTAPGKATLSFASDLSEDSQTLEISKEAKTPDIIYFISEPEEGVQNLPGDDILLKWRTNQLTKRMLNQIGVGDPLPADFSTDEGAKLIPSVSADVSFRLSGYDEAMRIERTLSVRVLRSGWYDRRNSLLEGDPGYPRPENKEENRALKRHESGYDLEPTLLLNANDVKLYAIFRLVFQGKERAFLFETPNPFGSWKFVQSFVPNQASFIPEGFSASPGVYFDDKLWLIGGSQIDPDLCSNGVWCFDPKRGSWESWEAATWSPRMGHGVLQFQNKIWVMGGRDAAGNPLNDVWTLETKTKTWTSLGQASWAPRCLFGPAVFQSQIWLYGGAQEPFSSKLYDDVYAYKNGSWTKLDLTGIITGTASRQPIASCLEVFNNRLCLFGKFRTVAADKSETVEPLAFSLSTPSTKTWDNFPNDGLKDWGGDTTFSYQLISFRNKMLIAKALSYEAVNSIMKIYVPG
jgi:Kelch motif